MLIFVEGHNTGAADHLPGDGVFFNTVTGKLTVVFLAPAVDPAHEVFTEQCVHQPPVAEPEALTAVAGYEQGTQHIQGVVTVGFGELCQDHGGVGGVPAEILGLVGEEAFDGLAEFVGKAFVVALVGFFNEGIHDLGVENIRDGRIGAVVDAVVFGFALGRSGNTPQLTVMEGINGQSGGIKIGLDLVAHVVGPVLGILQQGTAGKAAGPSVFVIAPGIHAQLAGLVHRGIHGFKPFFPHIGRFQAAPGVHEEATHTGLVHILDLMAQMVGLQAVVPAPERHALVIPQRIIFQVLEKFAVMFHLDPPYFIERAKSVFRWVREYSLPP